MHEVAQGPVVIVEDDASVSVALDRILRLGGYRSRAFRSAEEFLADDAVREAACLVIDVRLPGMTGFELYDRLCTTPPTPPVIFMSAFDDRADRGRADTAGAVIFLAKPFSGRSLLDAVRRAVSNAEVPANSPIAP